MVSTPPNPSAILLVQTIDYQLLDSNPRSGGLSLARHQSCWDFISEMRQEFPTIQFMLDRPWGVTTREFCIGRNELGEKVRSSIYGPQHSDIELDPELLGQTPSAFVNGFWGPKKPWGLYGGLPPIGLAVTSDTEVKKFLGPLFKPGTRYLTDMGTAVPDATQVSLFNYCSRNGIEAVGEPHTSEAQGRIIYPLLSGAASLYSRLALILSGNRQFSLHPLKNYAIMDGNMSPSDRVLAAAHCRANKILSIVEAGNLSLEQRRQIFAPVIPPPGQVTDVAPSGYNDDEHQESVV